MGARTGRQTPTTSVVLPYTKSLGDEAVQIYNMSGNFCQEWQELMLSDIMAVNDDGLWVHTSISPYIDQKIPFFIWFSLQIQAFFNAL